MKQKIWTEQYKVASFHVNLRGRAGLYSILNFIQDVGWLHAFHLRVEVPQNLGWVFTRQHLRMQEWPAWNETVSIKTWLRPPAEPFLFRDYEIWKGDQKIGECTSSFTVMDLVTRKMAKMDWSQHDSIWRSEGLLDLSPQKLPLQTEASEIARFQVRNSDLDMNEHMNNTKYAQWVLDSLPLDLLKKGASLHGYEVNFLAEAKSGDEISIQHLKGDEEQDGKFVAHFQGVRLRDQKPIFSAQLLTSMDEL